MIFEGEYFHRPDSQKQKYEVRRYEYFKVSITPLLSHGDFLLHTPRPDALFTSPSLESPLPRHTFLTLSLLIREMEPMTLPLMNSWAAERPY